MVSLLFEVAGQRYALDIAQVIEVVPAVRLRRIPQAPAYVAGVFRYRGAMVPVIDLSHLMGGPPASRRFSTRILLVQHPGPSGIGRVLGLLAEGATDSLDDAGHLQVSAGVAVPETPYLGGLITTAAGTVQHVRVEHLLPDEVRERLFSEG